MKYEVINSALFLNGKLVPEGSTIELSKDETEGIETYLRPIEEEATVTNSNTNKRNKTCPELVSGSNIKKEKLK